jgi:hypothetical protein
LPNLLQMISAGLGVKERRVVFAVIPHHRRPRVIRQLMAAMES